jgi:hypothetical protein
VAAFESDTMDITDTEERCLSHARIAARQAVMKGLDPELIADAFMLEAIKLTFGLDDDPEAARLVQRWKEQTFRHLDADYVTVAADGGKRRVVRLLRSQTREQLLNTAAPISA